jgi:DNA-binding MarR family transcriptional regulator
MERLSSGYDALMGTHGDKTGVGEGAGLSVGTGAGAGAGAGVGASAGASAGGREDTGAPEDQSAQDDERGRGGAAFLLTQLGTHAAALFAERISALDLTPAQAGLLRLLARTPGRSQRELADGLGMPPSRFVPFADTLEERGLIERRRNPGDRRLYALHLTEEGFRLLGALREVATAHEQQVCQALSPGEHEQLTSLLRRVADQQGLTPGVHPGYRQLSPNRPRTPGAPSPSPDPSA